MTAGAPASPRRRLLIALGTVVAAALMVVMPVAAAGPAGAAATSAPAAGDGWIRFGHFSAATGPVRVAVDGRVIDPSVAFEAVTPYQSIGAGRHVVSVTTMGSPPTTRSATVVVGSGSATTVTALPGSQGPVLTWFADNLSAAPAGDAKVRLINAVPGDDTVSGRLTPVASGPAATVGAVAYGQASPYLDVPAGRYDVHVAGPTGATVVTGTNWPVSAGRVASLVILTAHTGPTLEVLSDAAGPSAVPVGGMQTGYGGSAALLAVHPAGDDHAVVLVLVALAGLAGGGLWSMRRRSLRPVALGSVVALLAGAASVAPAWPSASSHLVTPRGSPSPAVVAPTATGAAATVSLAAATTPPAPGTPTSLAIPSIGVRAPVVALARNADGSAQVPATTSEAGWYSDGPVPGQTGPAVILGHVDSSRGPGVFFRLRQLQTGALVDVAEGGTTVVFAVQQVATYGKAAFPTRAVFGPVPDRALRLITCGGPFDRMTGHYEDNVVVFATEVGAA